MARSVGAVGWSRRMQRSLCCVLLLIQDNGAVGVPASARQCSEYCANKALNRSGESGGLATVRSFVAARLAWSLAQSILGTTLVVCWATLDRLLVRFWWLCRTRGLVGCSGAWSARDRLVWLGR